MLKCKINFNKIKSEYRDNKEKRFYYNLLIIALCNAIFLLAYFTYFRIYFAINDDVAMSGLMAGIQGYFPGYSVFVNFILSYLISKLARIIPSINWYGLYLLSTCYVSFIFIGTVILDKMRIKLGSAIYIVILACGFIPILSYFSFTTIAYIAILAGVIFIVYGYQSEVKSIKYVCYILGTLMFINGSFIRYKCFLTGVILLFAFIILEIIKDGIKYMKINIKKTMILGLVIFIVCGFSMVFRTYSMNQYYKDNTWNEYVKFNKARSNLIDFGLPQYYENKELYDSVGWSENDYNIFSSYSFPEHEKFSTENLEKIYEYKKSNDEAIKLDEAMMKFMETIKKNFSIQICILLILLVSIYNIYFSRNKLMSICISLFPFMMHIIFILMNRSPYRVVYPHYLIAVILLLFISNDYEEIFNENINIRVDSRLVNCILAMIIGSSIIFSIDPLYKQYNNRKEAKTDEYLQQSIEVYNYLCNDNENVYLTSMNYNGDIVRANSILRWNLPGSKENVISAGGWLSRSKNVEYFKDYNGIDNLMYDLVKKDNYFFVDKGSHINMYKIYFKETYNLDVSFDIVNQLYHASVYKVNIINNDINVEAEDNVNSEVEVNTEVEAEVNTEVEVEVESVDNNL